MPRKPSGRKNGRPLAVIDYDLLDEACLILCTGEECASMLGMTYHAMDRAIKRDKGVGFKQYFKKASAGGKMSLRRSQFKTATVKENVTMQIWLGKQWLGQTDKVEHIEKEDSKNPINIIVKS